MNFACHWHNYQTHQEIFLTFREMSLCLFATTLFNFSTATSIGVLGFAAVLLGFLRRA